MKVKESKMYNLRNAKTAICKILLVETNICSINNSIVISVLSEPILYKGNQN